MTGWRPLLAAVLAMTVVQVGACGEKGAVPRIERDLPYHDGVSADVHVPAAGGAVPVIVTLHGCCGGKHDLTALANRLATEGAVVFNASWRSDTGANGYPEAYERAACAVRFARAQAPRYGGDPLKVTVVGWSDGALLAAVVANAGQDFSGGCRAASAQSDADAVVTLGGFLGWPVPEGGLIDPLLVNQRTTEFFSGSPEEAAHAWTAGNPYVHLGRRPHVEIRLVVAEQDALLEDNRRFAEAARQAGHPVSLIVTPAGGHQTIVAPRTPEGATAVQEILGAARRRT
ncbi:MAG: alpha/beta hydrolase [Actinomycetota bacterium]|nr:alpha/beta hydrolase [Actinomycetota bacterium]